MPSAGKCRCRHRRSVPAEIERRWEFSSSDARAACRRRRDFTAFLRLHGTAQSDYDAAELIFGELVANVVRHAPGEITIIIEWPGAFPILHVDDRGTGFTWKPHLPHDPQTESTRGLFIIEALGSEVRVERRRVMGSRVSVVLPVTCRDRAGVRELVEP